MFSLLCAHLKRKKKSMCSLLCCSIKKFPCIRYFARIWRKFHVFISLLKPEETFIYTHAQAHIFCISEEIFMYLLLHANRSFEYISVPNFSIQISLLPVPWKLHVWTILSALICINVFVVDIVPRCFVLTFPRLVSRLLPCSGVTFIFTGSYEYIGLQKQDYAINWAEMKHLDWRSGQAAELIEHNSFLWLRCA
jgi:hypothetical protein